MVNSIFALIMTNHIERGVSAGGGQIVGEGWLQKRKAYLITECSLLHKLVTEVQSS